jgi:hypothetical protein
MRFIGRREGISETLEERMDQAEATTKDNDRITLFVAFNYGGRAEIMDAAAAFEGGDEEEFRKGLYAPEMHDLRGLRDGGDVGSDEEHRAETELQKSTDDSIKEIDSLLKGKEEEILEV